MQYLSNRVTREACKFKINEKNYNSKIIYYKFFSY